MKKKPLFLFLVCLLAVAIFSITASAETYGDLTYEVSNDNITITDCKFWATSVTIPPTIGGYPVTSIGPSAFGDCFSLESITIPNSVTSIGISAFYDTAYYNDTSNWENGVLYIGNHLIEAETTLSGIYKIKDGTKTIADNAFCSCTSLTSIAIPDSVTSIGYRAFNECTSLASVIFLEGSKLESIGDFAFNECTDLTSITIPDSVMSIGDFAFYECTDLTSITIPDSVMSIGDYALGYYYYFFGYKVINGFTIYGEVGSAAETYAKNNDITFVALNSVEIVASGECGDNLIWTLDSEGTLTISGTGEMDDWRNSSDIPWYSNRELIKAVVVDSGVVSIGDGAFWYCTSLVSVTIPNSVISIGGSAFYNCMSLEEVHIADIESWVKIGFYASSSNPLYYANGLYMDGELMTSITIPNNVTSIAPYAFYNCESLERIAFAEGSNLESISYYAFENCTGLTSITIPDSVTSISSNAFSNCTSLENITIPDSVTWISIEAFYNTAYYNNSSNWENGVLYIGNHLIAAETTVSGEYKIKDGTKTIADDVFAGCTNLTSITIPDSVMSISDGAFSGCTNLTNIIIPNSITSIGAYAFSFCKNLTSITIPLSVSEIVGGAFWGCTSLESITIPEGVTSIGYNTFAECTSLMSITIPDSVTSISSSAFAGCASLTIYGHEDSYAETYAKSNGITFVALNSVEIVASGECGDNLTWTLDIEGTLTISGTGDMADWVNFSDMPWYSNRNIIKAIVIDSGITSIGLYAFGNCTSLASITIPDSVTSIGNYAFSSCTSLESITIPSSVTSIGKYAFSDCTSLASITIPSSVTSIGEGAFSFCTSLESVTFEEGSMLESIGNYAFSSCTSLESITIPSSVTSIGKYAFEYCTSLVTVVNNSSLQLIPGNSDYGYVAYYAYKLVNKDGTVTYRDGYTDDGNGFIFDSSNRLCVYVGGEDTVTLPLTYNGASYSIYCMQGVRNVIIPYGFTSIGDYAFCFCESLTSITIPSSVTSIGEGTFYYCTGLTSITIPDSVTSIGSYAFYECTSLASITIPSSVTSIGEVTFYYCTSLASITIPSSVTSIGFGAFYDCDKLTIYGYAGSYAETYANENSIPFVEIQPIAIKGTSLILDGSIGIKTYLDIEEGYGASTTVKSVVYDTNRFNTISEDILTPVYDAEKELYYVMTYISPKDVDNTEVRNTLICGSVTLVGEPISISNYIADFKEIAKTDEELAKGLGVVEAIETYTKYADNFFSDTNALEDIACDTSALDKIAAPEKSGTLSGIKHISTALILEGNTTIRHYFEVADGKYTFEVGGEVIEATELGDGIIYVDIADIPAHNLDEIYTLTVNDTMIINFSALNYVKLALTSENSKLSNLVKALYNYWQSTEKYVNQI